MQQLQSLINQIQKFSWGKSDRVAPFALIILILLLCWKLAALFWWMVAPPQVVQADQVSLGSQQQTVPNISSFALFQEVGATAETNDANLVMQLQGVMVASPSQHSSAVIKVNDIADRYLVGESIENTPYQLAEVYWDKVVLRSNNGSNKILEFSGISNLYQPMGADASKADTTNQNQSAMNPQNNAPSNSTMGMTNTQRALGQAIEQIQENRDQYLKNMGVNAANGTGYEVTDQTPVALRNKLGLKSGDRILSLNGQTVGQGQTEAQLLEQAKREGKIKIEVKRGDQVMTFQQDL